MKGLRTYAAETLPFGLAYQMGTAADLEHEDICLPSLYGAEQKLWPEGLGLKNEALFLSLSSSPRS
jgi:hypothetical protein